MSAWLLEIRALATGDNNRSIDWCAAELQRAAWELVIDYRGFVAKLQHQRLEHRFRFACCAPFHTRRGRPKKVA